jgi:protocatechuate 3,4-dioxygenase beta subunit
MMQQKFMRGCLIIGIIGCLIGIGPRAARAATVTNTNDSGAGSLRQTIADATAGSTIDFSVSGTITLTGGEIVIDKDLTVSGPGAANLTISGNNSGRIFNITAGTVTLAGLKLTAGSQSGGNGGAVATGAGTALTLQNCTLANNSATFGGALYHSGDALTVTNCSFSSNIAGDSGGAIDVNQGSATITGSTFSANSAVYGGAIQHVPGLTSIISSSTFTRNTASNTGGAINNHGTITISISTFDSNSAAPNAGGAIQNNDGGTVTLGTSTFTGNSANWGAVLQNNPSATAHIINSTLSGNNVTNQGGAINNHGALDIHASTIVLNSASNTGGGIQNNNAGVVSLHSSILAKNTAGNGGPDCSGNLTSQDYNVIGNLSGAVISGPTTHNITGVDPLIGPLQNNGGTTFTHALLGGSPAIDAGDNAETGPPLNLSTDQRGFPRLVGSAVDIGSYERGAGPENSLSGNVVDSNGDPLAGVTITTGGKTTTTDSNGNYSFSGLPAGSYTVTPTLHGYAFSPSVQNVTITNTDVTGVNFTGSTIIHTISGRVVNSSGTGIPNVQITRTGGSNVVTDANGNYTFTDVPPGTYTIAPLITPSLTGVTFYPASRSVTVSSYNLTNINFTASFTVTGRVSNSDNVGLPNIQVTRRTNTSAVTVATDSNGNYRFTNVLSGSYTVAPNVTPSMTGMSFFPTSYNITVSTYNLTNINFTAFFTIKGHVSNSAGAGMANVLVWRSTPTSSTSMLTDSSGNYTFTGVRSGTYTITPTQNGKTFNPVSRSVTVSSYNLTNINFIGSG